MTTSHHEAHTHGKSPASTRLNGGSRRAHVRARGEVIAQRARTFVSALPVNAKEQLTKHPYRALGIAFAVGVGAGVVLSSRILRAAISSAVSVAIIELGRAYLLQEAKQELGIHPGKSGHAEPS